tara:strand:- start:2506 stop:2679 length:174 start_codon:yes stop_codon:yes gene_type:complete
LDRFIGINILVDLNQLIINVVVAVYFLDPFYAVEELTKLIYLVDTVLGREIQDELYG